MPYIMNALSREVSTQAHGKWFKWAAGQIKEIQNENLAMFLSSLRGEEGLVGVADATMELDRSSSEFKDVIEHLRKEGVEKRINKLDSIINNLEQSLRYDLEKSNIKGDPLTYASKGELSAFKERATLLDFEKSQKLNVADEIRKVKLQMEIANGSSRSTDFGANTPGHTSTPQPTQSRK